MEASWLKGRCDFGRPCSLIGCDSDPVFFASFCGVSGEASAKGELVPSERRETDARRESISEAVRFAKSNNLLGIMAEVALLNRVPSLVQSVKGAGLLLITIGKFTVPAAAGAGMGACSSSEAGGAFDSGLSSLSVSDAGPEGANDQDVDGEVDDGIVMCKS